MRPRVLYVVESVDPSGKRGPVDGEPIGDVVFTRRVDANLMARAFRRGDALEGLDTQIRVAKYVPQEPKR